jgi:hypothetical protein
MDGEKQVLRFAQDDKQGQKQIPFGNDSKKSGGAVR